MLGFFRRNLFVNLVLLLLFAIALQAYFFFNWSPPEFTYSLDIFGKAFFPQLLSNHYVQTICTIILIIISAVLIGQHVIQNKLSRALSLIPAAVFVLFSSFVLEDRSFDSILVANLFLIISIGNLFQIYKKYQPISTIFNCGVFLGLACLMYLPYLIYLVVLIFGLISLRNINIKESFQLLIGFLTPFFFAGVILYAQGNLNALQSMFSDNFGVPDFAFDDLESNIKLVGVVVTLLFAILFKGSLNKKKKFDAIKKIELCYWMLFLSLASIFFVDQIGTRHLMILSFPISVLIGLLLERKEGSLAKEFVFLLSIVFYFMSVLNLL